MSPRPMLATSPRPPVAAAAFHNQRRSRRAGRHPKRRTIAAATSANRRHRATLTSRRQFRACCTEHSCRLRSYRMPASSRNSQEISHFTSARFTSLSVSGSVKLRSETSFALVALVPKLCLGTQVLETLFRNRVSRKNRSQTGVCERRVCERGVWERGVWERDVKATSFVACRAARTSGENETPRTASIASAKIPCYQVVNIGNLNHDRIGAIPCRRFSLAWL